MKTNKTSAIKDKDLMADTGGVTKQRDYGTHSRPPRVEERDNFRDRYLTKEEKRDLTADIDLSVDENGQLYVNDQDEKQCVQKISDLVNVPDYVNSSYEVMLENSMNSDSNYYDLEVNKDKEEEFANFDGFQIAEDEEETDDTELDLEEALVDDEEDCKIETAEEENDFAGIFDDKEEDQPEDETDDTEEDDQVEEDETDDTEEDDEAESTNDGIDSYLNMEIDDSKLSEENKEKLDGFTSDQLDAFKKFLFENKIKKQE